MFKNGVFSCQPWRFNPGLAQDNGVLAFIGVASVLGLKKEGRRLAALFVSRVFAISCYPSVTHPSDADATLLTYLYSTPYVNFGVGGVQPGRPRVGDHQVTEIVVQKGRQAETGQPGGLTNQRRFWRGNGLPRRGQHSQHKMTKNRRRRDWSKLASRLAKTGQSGY